LNVLAGFSPFFIFSADAEYHLRKFIEIEPSNCAAWNLQGLVLEHQEKFGGAETAFRKSLALLQEVSKGLLSMIPILCANTCFLQFRCIGGVESTCDQKSCKVFSLPDFLLFFFCFPQDFFALPECCVAKVN
jgi:hypothetical protein